jgi:hypothetical protein
VGLRLYLDDCAYSRRLTDLLRGAGHVVVIPADAGLSKAADPVHFSYAVQHGLGLITKIPVDFQRLHEAVPTHPGLILICQDNDPSRDMNYAEIVQALANLEATYADSGLLLAGAHHELNHWRFSPTTPQAGVTPDKPQEELSPKNARKRRKGKRTQDDA